MEDCQVREDKLPVPVAVKHSDVHVRRPVQLFARRTERAPEHIEDHARANELEEQREMRGGYDLEAT